MLHYSKKYKADCGEVDLFMSLTSYTVRNMIKVSNLLYEFAAFLFALGIFLSGINAEAGPDASAEASAIAETNPNAQPIPS